MSNLEVAIKSDPTPKWVDDLYYSIVKDTPEIKTMDIAEKMINDRPECVRYLFKHRQGPSLSIDQRELVSSTKNKRKALAIYKESLEVSGRFEIDKNAISRMRYRLNRRGCVIFASSMLGHVCLEDMNPDRAQRYLLPRLSIAQHECMHKNKAVEIMRTDPEYGIFCGKLDKYMATAANHDTLSDLVDKLEILLAA
jgi:hypothetical protein